ncbi:MAG: hypothetical protein ACRECO_03625 [Xanthobacteraceae bacterium]
MLKAALAGVVLATTGATFCVAQDFAPAAYHRAQPAQRGPVVTAGHIARLRAALKLTPSQQKYWPAVERALRRLTGRAGSEQGWRRRASAAVGQADAARRVAAAARPLIGVLNDKQKQDGMRVIRALGFSSLASAM